jgi:hypothetical protein
MALEERVLLMLPYAAYNNWPAIVSFVARNADALKEFVIAEWHNPALVESTLRFAGSLPTPCQWRAEFPQLWRRMIPQFGGGVISRRFDRGLRFLAAVRDV